MAEPDEQAIAKILAVGRATRKRPSRALWIAAAIVGVACAVTFVVLMTAEPAPPAARPTTPPETDHGVGFVTGVVVGLLVGLALGVALARQRAAPDHSSESKP
ncbi:MAG TPA: hypothetical protein VFQ53_03080 [Kofleriaceae bacterium]|nr:hypothetical protein [Kofleriaceae bacterium]